MHCNINGLKSPSAYLSEHTFNGDDTRYLHCLPGRRLPILPRSGRSRLNVCLLRHGQTRFIDSMLEKVDATQIIERYACRARWGNCDARQFGEITFTLRPLSWKIQPQYSALLAHALLFRELYG
jgi:hypothetical protein